MSFIPRVSLLLLHGSGDGLNILSLLRRIRLFPSLSLLVVFLRPFQVFQERGLLGVLTDGHEEEGEEGDNNQTRQKKMITTRAVKWLIIATPKN